MNTSNKFFKAKLAWLPLGVLATIVCGLVYISVHHDMRSSANNPQIQIAEDVAATVGAGTTPESLIPPNANINIAKSLATYVVFYDESGKPFAGTGYLDGALPSLPAGVFDYTRTHEQDRITWQPQPGVRSAIVVVHYGGAQPGFILVGRSLREVERRSAQLHYQVTGAWLVSLILTYGAVFFVQWYQAKPKTIAVTPPMEKSTETGQE